MRRIAIIISIMAIACPCVARVTDTTACSMLLSGVAPGGVPTPVAVGDHDRTSLKEFGNRFRSQHTGVMVTLAFGNGAPEARRAKAYIQEVLENIGREGMDKAGIHVVVNIYSSTNINAFATAPADTPIHRNFLGVANDGKAIFEIGFLQGMLSFFRSEDELAFIIGHELGHITSNHLEVSKGTAHDDLSKWSSSQANEVEADLAGIQLMLGKYNLEASVAVLERLLAGMSKNSPSHFHVLSTHHHPSVRLGTVLTRIQQLRRTDPRAAPQAERPIRSGTMIAKRSPRNGVVTPQSDLFREQFWQWFDGFMAARTQKIRLHSRTLSNSGYAELGEKRVMADVTNDLFVDALKTIRGSALTSPEKLERVFELLTIYNETLYSAKDAQSAHAALTELGRFEINELERTLRYLSFGDRNAWSPDQLIREYDQRVETIRFEGQIRIAPEAIGDLINKRNIHPIFKKFAKVSERWRALVYAPLDVGSHLTPAALESTLKRALKHNFTPEHLAQFVRDLQTYSLTHLMTTSEGLSGVQDLFKFGLEISDSCDNKTLCRAIENWLKSYERQFKLALLKEMDRLLSLNFPQLTESDQTITAYAMAQLFSHGPFRVGLTTKDLSERGSKIQVWLTIAKRSSKGRATNYIVDVERRSAPAIANSLATSAGDRPQVIRDFLTTVPLLRPEDTETFLRTLSDQELMGLVGSTDYHAFQQPSLVTSIARLTSLEVPDIRKIGLKSGLIDRMIQAGVTSEILAERLKLNAEDSKMLEEATSKNDEARRVYNVLLGSKELSRRLGNRLTAAQLEELTGRKARLVEEELVLDLLNHPHLINEKWRITPLHGYAPHVETLIQSLLRLQQSGIAFERWYAIYHNLFLGEKVPPEVVPLKVRNQLGQFAVDNLKKLRRSQRTDYIFAPEILRLLPVTLAVDYLSDYFTDATRNEPLTTKSQRYEELRRQLKLASDFPDIDVLLKEKISEKLRLQPGELSRFFEKNKPLQNHRSWLRGISGLVAEIQTRSFQEQIEFIEYVAGRSDTVPASITEIAEKIRNKVDSSIQFDDLVAQARTRFARANNIERGLILLPFFTGASSMLELPGGQDFLLTKILSVISPEKRSLARKLAEGMLRAEGRSRSFAFALILGLKSESGKPMTEGEILRAIFSYGYGVPGIKFGQYLAFTSDFKSLLGELQDQALPISYLEAIKLLEQHFPGGLPDGIQVLGIKGSGSVNVGIEYFDPRTQKSEVLSVPREGVEVATRDDFRRLRNALLEVVKDDEAQMHFGFMLGLLDTIQTSVELEFNRAQVFKNHQKLSKILNRRVGGWQVKMVDVIQIHGQIIRMQMATGTPARLMDKHDPKTYREAMTAASTVITDHLMRQTPSENDEYFADSDFHDGQAFIDKKTKTVWLIDPGQAVQISRSEFDAAKVILRILSGTMDMESALHELNKSILNPGQGNPFYTANEIFPLMRSKDKNDTFIRFVSLTRRKGSLVPLAVVQWVFGMNRQLALSTRTGFNLNLKIWFIFAKEFLSQTIANPSTENFDDLKTLIRALWAKPK